ncbi:hypothetical protein [Clostridium sp. JS66]|uniref:hypothetical protein n=1 Tax=Clostridium sp. JS66 TaxID=3064705 RepID=UPI00298E8B59|nr:hypothetical protein [Clostridium sp. JS66]WPC41183.1 hypothetical protein Q6H37_25330 [Clostridium sp. JS66]
MSKLFEIKYSIFEDHKEELRSMSLEEFESEFTNIYGMFTLIFDGNEFIPYLDGENEFPLEVRQGFSELINEYFDGLIYIVSHLEEYPFFYLKYIENDTTWLKISVEEKKMLVSEIEIDWNTEMNNGLKGIVTTNSELFDTPLQEKWGNVEVEKDIFKAKVTEKLFSFISEIKSANQNVLKSKIFDKQIRYLRTNGLDIILN